MRKYTIYNLQKKFSRRSNQKIEMDETHSRNERSNKCITAF